MRKLGISSLFSKFFSCQSEKHTVILVCNSSMFTISYRQLMFMKRNNLNARKRKEI